MKLILSVNFFLFSFISKLFRSDYHLKVMNTILEELSQLKSANLTLNSSQIQYLDQLTYEFSNSLMNIDYMKIQNLWEMIAEAQLFWENAYLILNQSKNT